MQANVCKLWFQIEWKTWISTADRVLILKGYRLICQKQIFPGLRQANFSLINGA